MPVLEKDDVQTWPKSKVEKEMKGLLAEVGSVREKNGGTLEGVAGDDWQSVKEANASLTALGERLDEVREQETADGKFTKLSDYLNEADPEHQHPGHSKAKKQADQKPRDIGGLFVESEAFKAYKESGTMDREVAVPMSSLFGSSFRGIGEVPSFGDGLSPQLRAALFQSSDYPIQPEFLAQPVETLYQANNIGPLLPQGTTTSNAVRYPVETVTSTGAAETAEGGTKPEAQLSFAPTDEPVRKIAVTLPLDDEAFDDVPLLRAYLNARLRLFVQMREDSQLLNGNGTAPNLKGILNRSGINTATSYSIGGANPDQALVDGVFHAAMRVRDSFLEPDAVVMKPSVWEIAALAKDSNRNYLLGGPGAAGYAGNDPVSGPRIWGLKVVLNANMPAQSATNKDVLVGAFQASAMLIRRSDIVLAISDSHSTFFQENKVMLRAEERLALAVFRPAGFATVTSAA